MKLHLDKDAFHVLIESIHNKTGYRSDGVFIFLSMRRQMYMSEGHMI